MRTGSGLTEVGVQLALEQLANENGRAALISDLNRVAEKILAELVASFGAKSRTW